MMRAYFRNLVIRRLEQRVRRLLERHTLVVVAITGSVGKTSTKMAIAHTLEAKFRVMVSQSSYNSEIGLPLGFFGLEVPSRLYSPWGWWQVFRRIDRMIE